MRAAAKRTEIENLFETLANKSPAGVYIVQDGKFRYVNAAFQSATGYSEDELLGMDPLELVIPEDRESVRENAIKMLNGELDSPYQFRVNNKNGSIEWVMESVTAIQYQGRRATLGNLLKITERKQAEEALQVEKSKLQSLMDAIEYNVTMQDTEYNIIYQNEPSKRASGGDHRGEKCYRAYEGREEVCDGCPVEQAFKDGKSHTAERMTILPSGEIAFWENTANPIRDADGNIISCIEIARDITERKKQEQALADELTRRRLLVDQSLDGIVVIDENDKVYEANQRFAEMLGYTIEEVRELHTWDWDKNFSREQIHEMGMKADEKGFLLETKHTRKDGSVIDVDISINASIFGGQKLIFCVCRDVTERKQAEKELSKIQSQLSSSVHMAHLGPWEYDVEKDLFTFNDAFYELFRTTVEEVGGYTMSSAEYARRFVHPEDAYLVSEEVRKVLQTDDPNFSRQLDHRIIYADGEVGYVSVRFFIIKDETGRTIRTYGVNQDITERKQAEEALQVEKTKLQSLIDAIEYNITIQDTEYNIIFQNEPSKRVFGGDHQGEKCYRAYQGREEVCDGCPVEQAFKDGKLHTVERMTILPSGEVAFWENTTNPIRDAEGKIISCLEIARDVTERKQAEEMLQAEKNKLQSLIDAMEDHLSIRDTEYNIIFQNEHQKELWGDRVGEKCYRAFNGREKICDGCPAEKAFKDGKSHTAEKMHILTSGEVAFWENTANPIRDAEGKIVACLEIVKDITERKKQEQALADEVTQRRILVDQSLDGIVVLDVDARVVEANRRFAEMLGYTLEEVHELHTWDWDKNFPPEEILELGRGIDEEGLRLETKHTRKDGSVIDVDISISAAMYGGQKLIFCISRDITERKQAEEALRQSEEKYRTLFDNTLIGKVIIDAETMKVTMANRAAATILGFSSADEGIGLNPLDLVTPEERERVSKIIANDMFEQDLRQTNEFRVMTKDGRERWISSTGARVIHEGRLAGLVSFIDITERQWAEEKVQHLNLVLRAIRNINQLIATGTDRDNLLKRTCETFVETRGYYSAWIALLDESGRLITAAEAGLDKHSPQIMERLKRGELMDCVHKALEKPGILVITDKSAECIECPLAKEHKGTGGMSIRLEHKGKVYGVMTVSAPPVSTTEKDEHDLFEEVAGDIGFALYNIEQEELRKKAEETLQTEKNKLQSLIDAMQDNMTIQDREYNVLFQNEPAMISTGGDHRGEKCYRAYEGQESICEDCPVEKAFKDGKPHASERMRILPSGEVSFWENTANPIKDAAGEIVACLEIGRDITERKKAEETLQTEKNKLQSLIDAMADDLTIQDREYNIIFQNGPSKINTGGDHIGEKCYQAYAGRESICADCPVEQAFNDGKPHASEKKGILPSGEVFFREHTANPIRDAAGEIVACLEIVKDITKRKKQEQALADEVTRRRILVDQSLDGIVVLDVDARVVEANQRFAEMLGYTLEEVHELHTWDWDKNFTPEEILELGRGIDEEGLHLETKHTRKNGSVIDVDISISAAMYGGQKLIFCVNRDITERKKMAEALERAAEEWKKTFDSISDAVSIHSRDFQLMQVNKAFADLCNMKPHEIIGKHCYEVLGRNQPDHECPHMETLRTGKPARAEFFKHDSETYIEITTSPIFSKEDEVIGTVHVIRDITEQKLHNEQLMMADRLASIGELAAGTAHELNNPLTSIVGFSQLLMEKDTPDDIREDLSLLYNEAQRAANVTKNLLTFARKHAPVKQLNQVNNIILDVLKLRAHEHRVNNIEVQRRLARDLPEIMVDYFQIQQVLLNIILNAEYFMTAAHNSGTLTITTKERNGNVRILITDDGPGIPPENMSRLFDPFFTTKEAGKGTGLGLSICHGIVAEHGGKMYARSQPGKGATIVVELPINSS